MALYSDYHLRNDLRDYSIGADAVHSLVYRSGDRRPDVAAWHAAYDCGMVDACLSPLRRALPPLCSAHGVSCPSELFAWRYRPLRKAFFDLRHQVSVFIPKFVPERLPPGGLTSDVERVYSAYTSLNPWL